MHKMMRLIKSLLISSVFLSAFSYAEISVIVSSNNHNDSLDKDNISRVFLGKTKNFPDGSQAVPVDQKAGSSARESFNTNVLGKSSSQLKAYWSRLIFTGKGTPPKESGDDLAVKKLVAENPNLIGYVNSETVDGSVKVVYKF
ncbi:phosphate ABC transporter substrate-binding protein [Bacterioplanoides sp. SCSIO 12839]|uniref:phosphate ABC transporter substrate-binding protein n=1 Tax=Bacterioplanoides sp. SCSIO 12839 TaxID=2829569 RepID=UPI0021060BA9|nr:phosphate ABC transporter substrate-binding protein [Bacterioplanoides sp. SCSIO 12839]